MAKSEMVSKDVVLDLLRECEKEVDEKSKESKSSYKNEVSVSNRTYYQGVHVGAEYAANKLRKLMNG